jgi:hypothetical protein
MGAKGLNEPTGQSDEKTNDIRISGLNTRTALVSVSAVYYSNLLVAGSHTPDPQYPAKPNHYVVQNGASFFLAWHAFVLFNVRWTR